MSQTGFFSIDLYYPLIQFIFTAFVIALGILHLVKSTASKYFVVDANFEQEEERRRGEVVGSRGGEMVAVAADSEGLGCAVCRKYGVKKCSQCKSVRYCSETCQSKHWLEGHKLKCKKPKLGLNATSFNRCWAKSKELPQLKKVLFPYEDFVKLFNWVNMRFPPCGLLNCGNSCYANVVLQCLSCTRPLIAYLLEIGHTRKCKRNDWCFLCELETHVDRARRSCQPFSPINILSRLPNIGGNLGYGKQEDAHEFMRFAVDTMQSVCLDEFGGEKALHPSSQETTLIQYIFGGHLQSQVKCSKCNKISYRHENMMDLTVEIQGYAESLEECLNLFTAEEWLDGENMYKCDGCNDYVKACKRLAIHHAPNILTIALKRFQSGRFGKLNKRVAFPETLNLSPYMSEPGYDTDLYRLYAVVVHIDMLNASYFGHYICYTKDSCGNWYMIDDCKVTTVELEEVLSQGAYMLLYSRICVRPSCVKPLETCKEEKQQVVEEAQLCSREAVEAQPCSGEAVESITIEGSIESLSTVGSMPSDVGSSTEEEKQQEGDGVEEALSCLPLLRKSIDVEGSLNSLSPMSTDVGPPTIELNSQIDDSVHMEIDDAVEVNLRFSEDDPAASTADVPINSKWNILDMNLDGPVRFDPMPTRGYQLDLDMVNPESSSLGVKLDDCASKHPSAAGIASSVETFHGVLTLFPSSEASPSVKAHSLHRELSGTYSDVNSFEDGNRIGHKESVSEELSADDRLPSQSDINELAETACSLPCSGMNSVFEILQEGNSSSSRSLPIPVLEQVNAVKAVDVIPAAWITKGNTSKLDEISSSVPVAHLSSDTEMLDESNHILSFHSRQSPSLVQIETVESGNGKHADWNIEALSSNMNECNSPGFLDKQTRGTFQNRNEAPEDIGEVGSSCKVNNCNGSVNPASLLEYSRQVNNYDRNCDCGNLLKSTIFIKNKCEIYMDEDQRIDKVLGEAGDLPLSHCNGIGSFKNYDEKKICGFASGFIDRPSRKKLSKNDHKSPSLSENVSFNNDRKKLPRFG